MVNTPFDIRPSILVGDTADVYLQRTLTILRNESINPTVTMEFFARSSGVYCGIREVRSLLTKVLPESGSEVWSLQEGETIQSGEVVLRIKAPYSSFGLYETTICGVLASCTGWATAASECVEAADGIPVVASAARHVHPNVAANIDYAAVVGGCVSCSTVMGARLAGITPSGNMPHALPLIMGDAVKAIQSFDRHMPQEVPRIALVDTFNDEAQESLEVAQALRERLRGVRLDTPPERGGVTPDLAKEVRARLDQAGFRHVEIFVSGGFTRDRIRQFVEAGAPINGFAVGSYISSTPPNDFTADIHEIDGRPIAKRGRTPGVTQSPRLDRVM
ncbi:MAG: nicotinate phosphoribosyltransferase [SAR202 cluster bacterium]|jgi:nicotinate phosphoribosyltransferase|nr:nicotinate phosphoribosyltransferase [Chloroflexota bacterium]MDP6421084.1 nicotinate phosphoribosyltransferase [SAR202 cluster bacterium]HAL49381.1 nicotinate phosphoribosyltransferase [Dehalococcoidia bacterium]MDP6664241.1 nicotinate phosphoribosyltransferase [SAR202 cluster bacterium]MDP6799428.1 nicotinate phosphoribosyltransferase [SAR202 cluster bacterium]|tara:strand:+ start:1640 stop:2638 length:999 start_codon:yes stop_codon:yes gene_type:complete